MNLAHEVGDHLLGYIEVADDAVAKRPDGDDVRRRTTDHALGLGADGQNPPGLGLQGDDARLTDDDASIADVDQRIGCSEVNSDVAREEAEQTVDAEHDARRFLPRSAGPREMTGSGNASLVILATERVAPSRAAVAGSPSWLRDRRGPRLDPVKPVQYTCMAGARAVAC